MNELAKVIALAKELQKFTKDQFVTLSNHLTKELGQLLFPDAHIMVSEERENSWTAYYFKRQIVDVAKQMEYFADISSYRSWVRLNMKDGVRGSLLIAFHSYGREFNGLLACTGAWFENMPSDEGHLETTTATPMAEPLVFNYRDSVESAQERFEPWLEVCAPRAIQCCELSVF